MATKIRQNSLKGNAFAERKESCSTVLIHDGKLAPHRPVDTDTRRGFLNMNSMKRSAFSAATLAILALITGEAAVAACNATINGRPMTQQECALSIQVYGYVIPGDYLVDSYGNWVNANNPMHRGNTYLDAQRNSGASYGGSYGDSYGGSWSSGSSVGPNTIYDGSGGCEGGGCVNIRD